MTWVLALTAVVIAGGLLSLGFWLGVTLSRSTSLREREAAGTTLAAAESVSEMTMVLAKEANRQASLAEKMSEMKMQVETQADLISKLEAQTERLADNQVLLTDSFIQRGYLRAARIPHQTGEAARPPGPLPPDFIPRARAHESSSPPREPTATG
jgi:hypothetical protein